MEQSGKDQYQIERTLAPDEQMPIDFGKLIHDQVPDKDGQTFPPDLTSCTSRLRDLTYTVHVCAERSAFPGG